MTGRLNELNASNMAGYDHDYLGLTARGWDEIHADIVEVLARNAQLEGVLRRIYNACQPQQFYRPDPQNLREYVLEESVAALAEEAKPQGG